MSVIKTSAGIQVTFTVVNGATAATGVVLTVDPPAGITLVSSTPSAGAYVNPVWTIGAMAGAATETLDLVYTLDDVDNLPLEISATVVATEPDSSVSNNTVTKLIPAAFSSVQRAFVHSIDDVDYTIPTGIVDVLMVTADGADVNVTLPDAASMIFDDGSSQVLTIVAVSTNAGAQTITLTAAADGVTVDIGGTPAATDTLAEGVWVDLISDGTDIIAIRTDT